MLPLSVEMTIKCDTNRVSCRIRVTLQKAVFDVTFCQVLLIKGNTCSEKERSGGNYHIIV